MASLEDTFTTACADGTIPGALMFAINRRGDFIYSKAFGVRSLEEGEQRPLLIDDVLAFFSCTKLITSIAVPQVVEQGLIGLDNDIAPVLPELAKLPILTEVRDGKPFLSGRKDKITLRHLLTHSSGAVYPQHPVIQEYLEYIGAAAPDPLGSSFTTVMDSFSHPLVFEPGTSWRYGPGLDWAGLVVVRLTKMGLESYMQQNIFSPLGIHNLTFWPDKHPEMASRRASSSLRDPESGKALPFSVEASAELRDEFGGKGLHGTAPSYLKILHSILRDDERLLTKESTAMMFQPQLTEASQRVLQEDFDIIGTPKCIGYYIGLYPKARYDWGLGGVLSVEDSSADGHDWRRRGCLSWSGALNLFWFIDREAGLCGMYGSQVIPPGDLVMNELIGLFDKTMYRRHSAKSGAAAHL